MVARYVIGAILAFVVLVGGMLLVRPLIFSVAPPRDDTSYAVATQAELTRGPQIEELPLNRSHSLRGEHEVRGVVVIRVIASLQPGGMTPMVVNGWSPSSDCAVTLAGDRLRDCNGDTWTFAGDPISGERPLQRFPARLEQGAVMADFTRPVTAD
ncbi:MAG TPA: hypothetical protein VFK93_04125 [Candidatus Limnocylindria bacterium]|jgi:hypothetical protein|nr:hypothetical protein [Candidatus Limnocylindria bacterium]